MEATLTAMLRDESGKEAARRLRAEKRLPAVLYGKENKLLSLDGREAQKLLNTVGTSRLVTLKIKKKNRKTTEDHPVLIKEAQFDPVKGELLHLDFYEVSMDHKVTLKVPLVITGEEERVNDGSIIEQMLYEIEITCLPTQIPEKIEVDISRLAMNEAILAGDLELPEGVEMVTSPEEYLVTASAPRVEAVPEETVEEPEEAAEEPVGTAPAEAAEEES
ncbi:MAG: 50S ribosomal protein L25 [Firmicutes bacterium]|nr:50S ribosomal protein L25 [Bacillota bacterium]